MFAHQQLVLPGIRIVDQSHEQPNSSYEDVTVQQTQIHHGPHVYHIPCARAAVVDTSAARGPSLTRQPLVSEPRDWATPTLEFIKFLTPRMNVEAHSVDIL